MVTAILNSSYQLTAIRKRKAEKGEQKTEIREQKTETAFSNQINVNRKPNRKPTWKIPALLLRPLKESYLQFL